MDSECFPKSIGAVKTSGNSQGLEATLLDGVANESAIVDFLAHVTVQPEIYIYIIYIYIYYYFTELEHSTEQVLEHSTEQLY